MFWTPFCVESVSSRRGVRFFGLDAKFRRESAAGENFGPIGAQCATCAGNLRQFCVKVWRADSDAISFRILTPEIFPRTSILYPQRWLAVSFCILLYRFLQRRHSIGISASSFYVSLKTLSAENQFEPGSYAVSLLWC